MKKLLLSTVAVAAMAGSPAFAASPSVSLTTPAAIALPTIKAVQANLISTSSMTSVSYSAENNGNLGVGGLKLNALSLTGSLASSSVQQVNAGTATLALNVAVIPAGVKNSSLIQYNTTSPLADN